MSSHPLNVVFKSLTKNGHVLEMTLVKTIIKQHQLKLVNDISFKKMAQMSQNSRAISHSAFLIVFTNYHPILLSVLSSTHKVINLDTQNSARGSGGRGWGSDIKTKVKSLKIDITERTTKNVKVYC